MALSEDARELAAALLEAGREPIWVILVVGWYFGKEGREAALTLVEQIKAYEGLHEGSVY